ncbi:MAG: RNA polymerase sigma factor [Calditrichia bacterium]
MKKSKEEFLGILEANRGIIFKICNSYCSDSEDRKDLVQDVIVQLWRSFDKYDEQYKITTWMYRIALNVAISSSRKSATRNKYATQIDHEFVFISDYDDSDQSEDLILLRGFINQLDDMNKALMVLYLDGNSYDEMASILNISSSSVGTKLARIKQQLRQQFENLED